MRMECLLLSAIQDRLQARWLCQPENTEAVRKRNELENRKVG